MHSYDATILDCFNQTFNFIVFRLHAREPYHAWPPNKLFLQVSQSDIFLLVHKNFNTKQHVFFNSLLRHLPVGLYKEA